MKNAHFFDFETIVEVNSQCWIVDKTMPSIPILKISQSDFNLIKSGIYKSQGNSLNFNGRNYWFSKEIMELIKIKAKNYKADISNLSFSMQEFLNKDLIENLEYDIKLDNILHLKNTDDDIYIICSRNTKKNYELIISKIEEKLQDNGLKIKKYYYISETFYNRDHDDISHKKVRLLLQYLVGLKTDGDKFTEQELDKYDNVYYYDDEEHVINFAINCNKLLMNLLSHTESIIKEIIKKDLKDEEKTLIVNYVTNNRMNRFVTTEVKIETSNLIKTFENFKYSKYVKLYEQVEDEYIKKYKLFEMDINYPVSKFDVKDIQSEVTFAFADISDLGYMAQIRPDGKKDEVGTGAYITILKRTGFGSYSEVKETLLFAIPYLEEKYKMKFKFLEFNSNNGNSIFNNPEYIEDREFFILFLRFE